jgi:hypothetical protein
MIRPFTFITMVLAASSGAYLFGVKHRAQLLDDQLAQIAEQSRLDGQRIRVLQAQWALEIDPTRLQQLATRFTSLQPMQPAQLVTFTALQADLPPAGYAQAGSAAPGATVPGSAPVLVTGAATPAAAALPMPPAPPPATTIAFEAVVQSLRVTSHSSLHLAAARSVADLAPPRPLYTPPPRPPASPASALLPAPPPAPAGPIGAEIVPVRSAPPADDGGSLLGMAAPPPAGGNGGAN